MAKRIIISGGPCSGKTTLINALAEKGHAISPEKARIVIKRELALGSDFLPWKDVLGFSERLLVEILSEEIDSGTDICFMDRSIADIEGYLTHANATYNKQKYLDGITKMGYHPTVFFAPFWPEIYENDSERKETIEEASNVSDIILRTYIERGFTVLILPKSSIENRISFIMNKLL